MVHRAREAVEKAGPILGPLLFSVLLLLASDNDKAYRIGFLLLFVPLGVVAVCLVVSRVTLGAHPEPNNTAPAIPGQNTIATPSHNPCLGAFFWLYNVFTFVSACGSIAFPIIGYHILVNKILEEAFIPAIFAAAMLVTALSAVLAGILYQRIGFAVLATIPVLSISVVFTVLSTNMYVVLLGAFFWGIELSVRETTMRAAVADLSNIVKSGPGYFAYDLAYGTGLLIGATAVGFLYAQPRVWLYAYVGGTQAAGAIIWIAMQLKLGVPKLGRWFSCCQ